MIESADSFRMVCLEAINDAAGNLKIVLTLRVELRANIIAFHPQPQPGSQAEVSAASEVGRETVIAERRLWKHVDSAKQHMRPRAHFLLARHNHSDTCSI